MTATLIARPRGTGDASARPGIARLVLACGLSVLIYSAAFAQSSPGGTAGGEGVDRQGYHIRQTIELGYRYTDTSGSGGMYDSLVNLHSGPRILEQTLSMQSLTQEGTLFDHLFVSSFGWGGDPNNVLRVRIDKNKWYNFQGAFRRDQNFFDYNLLANPLNPSTSSPNIPAVDSPHSFATTRRMTDFDLTLLPQSKVSFRFGYSHNNMTGPSYSSFHEGTDVSLYQPWNTTLNSWRFGADWKMARRTTLSYTQNFDYFDGDTSWLLAPFAQALLPGGAGTVELGLPINTGANQPCAIPAGAGSLIDSTGTLTNLRCNAYFSYSRQQRVRTSIPTEQVSLRSSYFDRLELAASYSYSSADTSTPLTEAFNGLVSRTATRGYSLTGQSNARRISDVANIGATLHLTRNLRLVDNFYFWGYRIPQSFASTETDANCSGTCTLLTAPDVTAITTVSDNLSFNQNWKRNQLELVWDITKKYGVRIGWRYGNKVFDHFLDFSGDMDHLAIQEQTAVFGAWARPLPTLRLNFDWEHANFNNVVFRISPRKESRYRAQANYTPRPWAALGAALNMVEDSNLDSAVNYRGHNRNYSVNFSLTPAERYGMDFAYNYNDYQQNALICFNDTPPPGVSLPVVTEAASCAANDSSNPLLTNGFYTNTTHYVMAAGMFKPLKRVTTRLGYSINHVNGSTPQFNILQPLGSLSYSYQLPLASLAVDLGHDLTLNAGWNYYQYAENSFVGPTLPRYFHSNSVTTSVRWAF